MSNHIDCINSYKLIEMMAPYACDQLDGERNSAVFAYFKCENVFVMSLNVEKFIPVFIFEYSLL
jgi:hypothetical protein